MVSIIWLGAACKSERTSIDTNEQQLLTALSGGRSIFQTARNGPIKVKHVPTGRMIPRSVNHPQGCRNPLVRFTSIQEAISKRASGVSARTTLYFCIIETSVYVAYWIFPRRGVKKWTYRDHFPWKNSENYHRAYWISSVVYKSVRKTFVCPVVLFIAKGLLIRRGFFSESQVVAANPGCVSEDDSKIPRALH